MSFWSKLGQTALRVAPYAAAPFTGGTSLMARGTADQLADKWAQHDVNARASEGLGPSNADRLFGQIGNYSHMAENYGGRGGGGEDGGSMYGNDLPGQGGIMGNMNRGNGGGMGGFQQILGGIMNRGGGQRQPPGAYSGNQGNQQYALGGRPWNYQGQMRGLGPVMGRRDQNNPNLAESIGAGRQNAIMDQPFRMGYPVTSYGPEPADDSQGNIGPQITTQMPQIHPTGRRIRRNPSAEQDDY